MKAIILAGIPGSGKSTYASRLPGASICSADSFFIVENEYKYNPELIGEAHRVCLRNFIDYCIANKETIVVDNTNTDLVQIAPYYSIARCFNYEIEIVKFNLGIEKSRARNIHNVPARSIKNMSHNFERLKFPGYWQFNLKEVNPNMGDQ